MSSSTPRRIDKSNARSAEMFSHSQNSTQTSAKNPRHLWQLQWASSWVHVPLMSKNASTTPCNHLGEGTVKAVLLLSLSQCARHISSKYAHLFARQPMLQLFSQRTDLDFAQFLGCLRVEHLLCSSKFQPSGEKNYSCWKILICRATRSVDKSRICSCNMQLQILDLSIDRVALHIKIFQHVLPLKLNLRLAVFNFVFQGDATKPLANAIAIGHSLGWHIG